jgi:glyoxylase-like metal-dependent hydrolase (beta-lactamase superfamily II)
VPTDTILYAAKIGNVTLVAQPGEPLTEYGVRLLEMAQREGYNPHDTFIWGYTGDHVGYILPPVEADWATFGGAESTTTFWGWKQGERFIKASHALLDALRDALGDHRPGDRVQLALRRDGKELALDAYLVAEDDGLTVVDTGIPGSAKAILGRAEALGAPIRRIALTHAHGDHIGSLDALAAAVGGVEVIISARDARLLRKDRSMDPGEPQDKLRGSYPGAKTAPTHTVEAGARIGSLEVIAAPGHTPGHVAFLDTRDGTLLCGDAYTTLGGVATTGAPNWRFPLAVMATWSRELELQSARALRDLRPARLAPGHGPVVDGPIAAMNRAIAKAG